MSVVAVVHLSKIADADELRQQLTIAAEQYELGELHWAPTTPDDFGTGAALAAVHDGAELVIAVGGDGTVRAVVSALAGTGVPLGIVGRGTGNLLARNVGIPLETTAAIGTAFGGVDRTIDVIDLALGKGRHEVSAVMAGMGWGAAMMRVSEHAKARLGWGPTRCRPRVPCATTPSGCG